MVVYTTGKIIMPTNEIVQRVVRNILRELTPEEFDIVIGSDEAKGNGTVRLLLQQWL